MAKSNYDVIASEYYDDRHITSRNFDEVTKIALAQKPLIHSDGLVLECGAGRGRAKEFLGVPKERIIQLDASETMLSLQSREECVIKIQADACDIPLSSGQFKSVVGFLVDPFLGLSFLQEAFRMLKDGGQLLLTTPTLVWGQALRSKLDIDVMETRFKIIDTEKQVRLPSILHSSEKLEEMLLVSGFSNIVIEEHYLPETSKSISEDIKISCELQGIDLYALPIINTISARK